MADKIGQVTALTLITLIKPGQAPSLRQVLEGLQILPDSPIKRISTIHFARWVIIDNDTRLLFTSNFDGTWERYLKDFSELTPEGLDRIWSHCEEYPGARPYEPFSQWVKKYQIPTTLFYAAYPELTVKEVLRTAAWKRKFDQFLQDLDDGG